MIPLHDDNPTVLRPVVTVSVIIACVVVFLWQVSLPPRADLLATLRFGAIPAVLLGYEELPPGVAAIPAWATILTSMFMHGGWMHLIGNMLFLWVFGNNVEDSMGHGRFVAFYLLCGLVAAAAHALGEPTSTLPMIGASGAISGVLGAYLLLYPHARVLVLFWFVIFFKTFRIPAKWVLGFWIVLQVFNWMNTAPGQPGVAWLAHIGGFVAGMMLIPFFKRSAVPLFRDRAGPWG